MPKPKNRGNSTREISRNAEVEAHAAADKLRHQHEKLQGPPDEHADGKGDRWAFEIRPDEAGRKDNDRGVQDHRRGGGQGEIVEGIQDADADGRKAKEEEVGKHNAVEGDGFVPTGDFVSGRSERVDHVGGKDNAENDDHGQDESNGPEEAVGEVPKLVGGALAHIIGEYGYERGREGAISD